MSDKIYQGYFKLQEEMGELNQAMAKLAAFPSGVYWDGSDLIKPVSDEIADVFASLKHFATMASIEIDYPRVVEKLDKYMEWGLTGISATSEEE